MQESNAPSGGIVSIPALGWYTIQFIAYTTEDNTPLYMSLSTRDISDLTYDNLIYVTNTPITYQWKINYQDENFSVKDNILKFWHLTENASVVLKNIQIQLGNVSVQFPTSSGSGSGGSGSGSGSGSGNGDGSGNSGGGYDFFGKHVTMGQNPPNSPDVGDIWYVTDDTGKVIDIRTWDGTKWVSYLDVDSLNKAIDEANQAAKEAEEVGKHAEEVANEVNERVDQAAQETQDAINQAQDALDEIDAANVRIDSAISNAEHAIDISQTAQTEAEAAQSTANNAASQANDALTNAQKAWDEAQTKADANGVYTKEEMDATLLGYASKTTVNILTGRVDQAETNITQNANKIDLKADQSTVNELTGQVSTVESEISQQADEISARITKQEADSLYATQSQLTQTSESLTSSITKVQTNLDGLEVGTTNLYQQSGFVKLNVSNFSIDQSDPTGYIYSFTIPANTTPTWTSGIQYNFKNVLLSPGKYYTYSWDTYSDVDGIPIYFDPNNYDNPDFTGYNDNDDRNKRQFNCPTTIANKWVHCIVTIYMPASLTQDYYDGSTICLQKGWENGSSDVNIKIRHVKVEQGNKATDWSLSPADTATIVQFSQLQQTVDGINTVVTKKLDQTAFNSYTAQTADTIATLITKTDASNTYATKSALSQTSSSLSTEIQQSENDAKSYADSRVTQTANSLQTTITAIKNKDKEKCIDPSFENGLISISGDAFIIESAGSDNGNYHSGTKSIRASGQSNTSYICDFPVYPGMKLRLSWWVRTSGDFTCEADNTKIRTMLNGSHWVDLLWTKGVKTDWTYDEKVVTIPDQPTSGQMFFTATVNTMVQSGFMKIDDVSIMDVTDEQQVQSQISQLSDDINLRVKKNDVINQINISPESILIAGNKIHITGQTSIDNAVIKDAMIANLSASKITTGTLDASKATITNINASNISTGTLNSARIAADSIDASKLNVSTLSAITANLGNVNAGNISGVVITGSTIQSASSGNRIVMGSDDYAAYNGNTKVISLGYNTLQPDHIKAPRIAIGINGMNPDSMTADGSYFVINHYKSNDNPENNSHPYVDLAYACTNAGDNTADNGRFSNIKMYDDGNINITPVRDLVFTTQWSNGSYTSGEHHLARFASSTSKFYDSHLEIDAVTNINASNGLILADYQRDPATIVQIETDSSGNQFVRPMTESGSIQLGSTSRPWEKVITVNGVGQSSSITKKSDIRPIRIDNQTNDIVTPSSTSTLINEKQIIDFVDNLNVYSFTYKHGKDIVDNNGDISSLKISQSQDQLINADNSSALQIGVIAEEYKNNPIARYFFDGSFDDGSVSVKSLPFLMAAIIKIKAQNDIINDLQSQINNLQSMFQQQEIKIADLQIN